MPHRTQLDGLRFLAFLAVFVYHAREEGLPWGWAGVEFFFALSGFLITRILVRGESGRPGRDLRRYYLRRALRIFPLYYAVIALVAASGHAVDVGWFLSYTYNIKVYFTRVIDGVLGHFWTLCVEEQFYLLYPLALLLVPPRCRIGLVAALIAGSKAFQVHENQRMMIGTSRALLPYSGEDLLWGCLAGLIDLRAPRGRHEGRACLGLGLPALVLAWNLHEHRLALPAGVQDALSTSLFGIGSALIVFGAWRAEDRWIVGPLSWAPVAYLGRISYGLYAFHVPVLRLWYDQVPYGFLVPRPYGQLALTVGLAAASWRYFERPINRLKDRAAPAPTVAATGDDPGRDGGAARASARPM